MTDADSSRAAAPSPGALADRAARPVYELLHDADGARSCKDIPEAACRHLPRNVVMAALALGLTKTGDRLMDPKIVLAWMASSLGAPAAVIGFLSPVRESLALLPQLLIAKLIRQRPRRKAFWALGSLGQAAALVLLALSALSLTGWALGAAMLGCLALSALARGICSVSHKDVLGKTVAKTRRGAVSGYASSASGVAAGLFGGALIVTGLDDPGPGFFAGLLLLAAGLWALAAGVYMLLVEEDGSTDGGRNALGAVLGQLRLLRDEPGLRDFLIVRAGLMATALATPFFVAIARDRAGADLSGLGGLLIASAAASGLGGAAWGRMSDRSSQLVLAGAGALGGLSAGALLISLALDAAWAGSAAFYAACVFVLALAHEGVRLGRSTYLVDMADERNRAGYTAVSNTVIGALLLIAGGLTGALYQIGPLPVLGVLTALALGAAGLALRLKPVSG